MSVMTPEFSTMVKIRMSEPLFNPENAYVDKFDDETNARVFAEMSADPGIFYIRGRVGGMLYMALSGHPHAWPPPTANPMMARMARAWIARQLGESRFVHQTYLAHRTVADFGDAIMPRFGCWIIGPDGGACQDPLHRVVVKI